MKGHAPVGHLLSTVVARCFRGAACPYKLRGLCWFLHEEPAKEMAKDTSCHQGVLCPEVQIVEQIQGLIVALQGFVETFKMIPLERDSQFRERALGSSGQAPPERSSQPELSGLFWRRLTCRTRRARAARHGRDRLKCAVDASRAHPSSRYPGTRGYLCTSDPGTD